VIRDAVANDAGADDDALGGGGDRTHFPDLLSFFGVWAGAKGSAE
jgi:hypothetical protein